MPDRTGPGPGGGHPARGVLPAWDHLTPARCGSRCELPADAAKRLEGAPAPAPWPAAGDVPPTVVAEGAAVYRPRHPERTVFYRLFQDHFDRYLYSYEQRFEPRDGPLRAVVPRTVEAYLACGRLQGGFARIRCPSCGGEHILAFSCRTKNFCPSCQAKRAALLAEKLADEILAPVPHRHYVFSIPKVLRGLFERERRLLGLLSQSAYAAIRECFLALYEREDVRPGMVASIQTFGSFGVNFHPHLHCLVAEGVFTQEGVFLPLPTLDTSVMEKVFRRVLLARLHGEHRLSEGFMRKLLSWRRSGFSVYGEQVVEPDEPERLGRLVRYLVRAPVALGSVTRTGDGRVSVRTPPDPRTGETVQLLDPLEWIHRLTQQIPLPRSHSTRYYGAYANRVRSSLLGRGKRRPGGASPSPPEEPSFPKARNASWARLLRKLLEVEPMVCPRCREEMKVVSVITDPQVVDRILRHLARKDTRAHDPFEPRPPPPA